MNPSMSQHAIDDIPDQDVRERKSRRFVVLFSDKCTYGSDTLHIFEML